MRLTLATLLLFALPAVASAEPMVLDRVVAVVNTEIILESDLARSLRTSELVMVEMQKLGPSPSAQQIQERLIELRPMVLDEAIGKKLVISEAPRFQQTATEAEVESYVRNIVSNNQMGDVADLRKAVETSGQYSSWEEYRESLREQILIYKVEGLLATFSVSDAQVREHYRKLSRGEDARVEVIPFSFPAPPEDAGAQDKAFAAAKAIARRLSAGESVDAIAAETGFEIETKTIHRGEIPRAREDALFAAKAGEIIGPLRTGQGFVVYRVAEVHASDLVGFEAAKDRLTEQLMEEARRKAIADLHEQLRSRAHVEIRL